MRTLRGGWRVVAVLALALAGCSGPKGTGC